MSSTIDIFGFNYRIEYDERLDESGLFGELIMDKLILRLSPTAHEHQIEETLLHEIIEGLAHYQMIKIEHDDIIRLSHGLYQVFKTNNMVRFANVIPLVPND